MALHRLSEDPNVELRELPKDVRDLLRDESAKAIAELTAKDPWAARLYESYSDFLAKSTANQKISELSYLMNRGV